MDTVQTSDERTCVELELLRMLEEADEKKKDEMREKLEQIASRIQRDPGQIFPSPGVWLRFHIMRIFQRRKKEADIDQRYWAEQGWLGRKRPWKET